ncbi:flavodoxin family protein [Kribbella sp. CA-293567]|uniref:flavodoxin family protein n=1 Tax=Kribbella sp. CA-293567 TaxID=3002436 RepID=UPI0022DE96F7|nr:flavodoxin family protein [Kribbella sp. CA-293567]WBQ04356.1 flavodoxin family protein [Kribbella sp. CA-293567]
MKVVALSSSPRSAGNSRLLTRAVLEGVLEAGHEVELIDLPGRVGEPLRDCRVCRRADGACAIEDDYEAVLGRLLDADAVVLATPLYWYGVSGQLKIFIDRLFCHTSNSAPKPEIVLKSLVGKRLLVVISSEETYPGAISGVVAQFQELSRYLHWQFAGVVRGVGNSRGEVARDPDHSVELATAAGRRLFDRLVSDYQIDTLRSGRVWG